MTDLLNTTVRATHRMSLIATALIAVAFGVAARPNMAAAGQSVATAPADGVIRTQSAYPFEETVDRLKSDIAAKGIRFFTGIDQAKLAADADIHLGPSTLLLFGNPPLGVQFLASNPYAGLDWPVRMLVLQDQDGKVWVAYSDFSYLARRYDIADRDSAFAKASEVAASIAASVATANP
jgi:uncharacterized protein (DUF302 family)